MHTKNEGERDGIRTEIAVLQDVGKIVATPEGNLIILKAVSLRIKHGETIAITGASGSGKSTLLGLMAGLDLPTEGKIHLFGKDLTQLSEDSRARLRSGKVGFVFQSFQLIPHLDALENVMLPLELEGHTNAKAQAKALLARVGLGDRLNHFPTQLSGRTTACRNCARILNGPGNPLRRRAHRKP